MFAWGDVGSNDCPPKYFKIGDSTLCRRAMAIVDSKLPFYSRDPSQYWPSGCSRAKMIDGSDVDEFSWNPLSAGAASPGKQLLCIGMRASPHGRPAYAACVRARAHL